MGTDAKKAFDKNIERASYFLDIHEEVQAARGLGAPPTPYRELPRGAVVFAVGAMDAYTSEVSAEVLVARLRVESAGKDIREVLRQVQRDIPTLSLEVAILASERERIDRVRNAIVDHFHENVSAIGSAAVAQAVRRMGRDANDLWASLEGEGYTRPAGQLDTWTDVRHRIVHRGARPEVRRNRARKFIQLAERIAHHMDHYAVDALG